MLPISRPRALFFGTPEFAIPSLDALCALASIECVGVITQPDKPVGRSHVPSPTPVAVRAAELSLSVFKPDTRRELSDCIAEIRPDVCVVVAYGRIIPPISLSIPQYGLVNLHPSLLPRWRGPSPIAAAIAAGDNEAGVSVMLIDSEIDHGPLLAQERITLTGSETKTELESTLAQLGAPLLVSTLAEFLAGKLDPIPQDDASATTCPLLSRESGQVDWSEPASSIERKVRAYEGWPGTWATLPDGRRLKVLEARVGTTTVYAPGHIIADGTLAVACGDRTTIELLRVQPEGKQPMSGIDFLRGQPPLESFGT
ncbi:MAG: methionyl-tRNA formyltransferase [Candidatus Uhrbacteria bacterium]